MCQQPAGAAKVSMFWQPRFGPWLSAVLVVDALKVVRMDDLIPDNRRLRTWENGRAETVFT
jgi:hypothetical protein